MRRRPRKEYLVVVKQRTSSVYGRFWTYHIFFRGNGKSTEAKLVCDFEDDEDSLVQYYTKRGWEYVGSGSTMHDSDILLPLGIKDPDDLSGLVRFIAEMLPNVRIFVDTRDLV